MKMKTNIKFFSVAVLVLGGMLLNACSTTDDFDVQSNKMIDVSRLQFSLTDEPFSSDNSTRTRTSETPVTQTIDLGNGLTAEVSIECDSAEQTATRAGIPLSNGKYYIYAVGNDGKRIKGADKLLSGKLSGGVFKPDNFSTLVLPAGTYTFVCYNEYVNDDGDKLTFTDDQRARVGVTTQTLTPSPAAQEVAFAMKRQVARVRFKIAAYTKATTGVKAKLISTANQPTSVSYTDLISNPQTVTSAAINAVCTFPATSSTRNNLCGFDFITPYAYYMAGTDGAKLKVSFSAGTIYQKSIAGKDFPLNHLGKLVGNASYTVRIKFTTFPLYLFHDGTCGLYEERDTRTAIGLVINEKTANKMGKAVGLEIVKKDFGGGVYGVYKWEDETKTLPSTPDHLNTTVYNGVHDGQNDMNGYNWTWDANSTKDHVVRGDAEEKYPAFYGAGHYKPSNVTVTGNIDKWYIPAAGEVMELFRRFGTVTVPANEPWRGYCYMAQTDIDKMLAAFTKANSDLHPEQYFLWTSTVCDAANTGGFGPYLPVSFNINGNGPGQVWWPTFSKTGANFYILPFVHF